MRRRVVIADDHLPVLASMGAAVTATGAQVVARARSPDEVLAALRDHACDLLICDYAMPVDAQVDGIEMIHHIRTQWPALPVIMLTTMSNGVILRALLEHGVRGLIDKAAPALELHTAVLAMDDCRIVVSPGFADAIASYDKQMDDRVLRGEIARMVARGRTPDDIATLLHVPRERVEASLRPDAAGEARTSDAQPAPRVEPPPTLS
ncbi:MAG TPA: response regulator transcription factor [Lysobacter sp.]